MAETQSQLAGTWKLLSFDVEVQETGERQPLMKKIDIAAIEAARRG